MKHRRKRFPSPDPEVKLRYCDPGACHCCQYIGDGDFLCDEHQEIVVSDWEPTEHHMMCKRKKKQLENQAQPVQKSMNRRKRW